MPFSSAPQDDNSPEPAGDIQHPDASGRGEPVGSALGDLDFGTIAGVSASDDYEPVQLTDRELAIASGEDPDADLGDGGSAEPASAPQTAVGGARGSAAPQSADADWIDDGVRFTAERMGFDNLEEFGSKKAFYAAARHLDARMRQLAEVTAMARDAQGRFVSPNADPATPAATPAAEIKPLNDDGTLNADYYLKAAERGSDEFNDETLALVRVLDAQQRQIREMHDAQLAQQEAAEAVNFHHALDQLDPEFFGRSLDDRGQWSDITEESIGRRQRMMAACTQVMEWEKAQAEAAGRQFTPAAWDDVKVRAFALAFGRVPGAAPAPPVAAALQVPAASQGDFDPLTASPSERERAIAGSMRRRGAGAGNSSSVVRPPVNSSDMDEAAQMANHPRVVATWNRLMLANGSHPVG